MKYLCCSSNEKEVWGLPLRLSFQVGQMVPGVDFHPSVACTSLHRNERLQVHPA